MSGRARWAAFGTLARGACAVSSACAAVALTSVSPAIANTATAPPPAPEAPAAPAPPSPETAENWAAIQDLFAGYRESFPGVAVVTVDELTVEGARPVVFIDVRPERERRVSHIPGSVTREEFEQRLDEDPAAWEEHQFVAYCTIGYRSGEYAEKMGKKGVTIANLYGSILAWVHAGQPVVNQDGATAQVHVYGKPWDLLPEGYEAIW